MQTRGSRKVRRRSTVVIVTVLFVSFLGVGMASAAELPAKAKARQSDNKTAHICGANGKHTAKSPELQAICKLRTEHRAAMKAKLAEIKKLRADGADKATIDAKRKEIKDLHIKYREEVKALLKKYIEAKKAAKSKTDETKAS